MRKQTWNKNLIKINCLCCATICSQSIIFNIAVASLVITCFDARLIPFEIFHLNFTFYFYWIDYRLFLVCAPYIQNQSSVPTSIHSCSDKSIVFDYIYLKQLFTGTCSNNEVSLFLKIPSNKRTKIERQQ